MQTLQLYIEGTRIDLFDDEQVSLTQTIQNVRDIGKVFTDFSKSFTIPASKTNSKLFKHYEKFVIDNGFDARKRVDARIEINRIPFKYGRVRLDGVELKDGVANAYKITFFGNTIKLKDAIGEEKLSVLDLSRHDQVYSQSEVKAALLADPEAEDVDVIVPLITHSQRLTYGSNSGANTGDLKPGGNNGVLWSELKYAIRIDKIVQAIATHYGFTYSADSFFNHTIENPNLPYYNLFMWLHRKKGGVLSDILQDPLLSLVSGFVQLTPANSFSYTNGTGVILTYTRDMTQFSIEIYNPSLITYDISLRRGGEERLLRRNISDSSTTIDLLFDARDNSSYEVYAYATSTGDLTFTWTAVLEEPGYPIEVAEFAATQSIGSEPSFNISEQIPEMKVMDFLSALFKMFNLVATVDENNVVTVKTLDVYYGEGDVRDITKYTHNDSGSVDAAIPYAEIDLKYKDTETILAKQFDQLKNREWGSDTYNSEDNLKEGGTFSLEVPFSHMQYERLPDLSSNNLTNVMYGYYVDDNQDAYLGAPLVFYPILNPLGSYPISYVTTTDANGDFTATETISTSIIIPSNTLYIGEFIDTDNIHFFPEASEYYPNYAPYKTLFYNYHWNYIASLFNFRKRMTKIKATLPVNFLINYSLADTILYKGLSYRINSINTNLNTGESSLELLNTVTVARPTYTGPSSTTTSSTTTLPPAPTLSVSISGNGEPKEGTQETYSATVGGTATGTITYSWSVTNGTISGSSTGPTVDIIWPSVASDTSGSVSVDITRGGENASDTLPVIIKNTSFGIAITQNGSTNLITPVAENSVITYGTLVSGNATGAITYDWTVVGGTFTGEGTDSITVTWSTAGSGSIRVDAIREGVSAFDEDPIEVTSTAASISVYARTPLENFNMTVQASVNGNPYQNVLSGTATSVCSLIGTISGLQGGDSVVVRIIETGVPGEKPINANNTTSCPNSVAGASATYSYGTVSVGTNNLAVIIDNIPTIYTLDLGYAPYITEPPALTACQRANFGPLTEVYVDSTDIQSITRFYDDATGTSFSPSTGYYSDGVYAIEWNGTAVVNEVLCAAQTTTTSDPSQDLLSGYDFNTGTGWTSGANACSAPGEDVVRIRYNISNSDTVSIGTAVYTDNGLTSPLNGGNLWYHYYEIGSITPTQSLQINNSGVIVNIFNC